MQSRSPQSYDLTGPSTRRRQRSLSKQSVSLFSAAETVRSLTGNEELATEIATVADAVHTEVQRIEKALKK